MHTRQISIFYTHFLQLSLLLLRPRSSQIKQQGSLFYISCLHFSLTFLHLLTPSSNGSWEESAEYSTNDMKKNTEGSSMEAMVSTTLPPLPRRISVTS